MHHLALGLLIAGTTAAAVITSAPDDPDHPRAGAPETPASVAVAPDMEVMETYTTCSAEAEHRLLSHSEAQLCLDAYLRLKLSFVPGMDMDRFRRLSIEERWKVNQQGYGAYVAWKAGARAAAAD